MNIINYYETRFRSIVIIKRTAILDYHIVLGDFIRAGCVRRR